MKIKNILLISIFLFVPLTQANAAGIESIESVKSSLFKRIQCSRESNTPAGGGLGSLWGCYSQNEEAKLWINGVASDNKKVQSIKFSTIKYHSRNMDITGRIWSGIVAEVFGKDKAPEIKTIFKSCPSNKAINFPDREIIVKCSKGPKADEHLIIVFPK